ncbi:MAG: carboxypeptidase-like regulatory domain-containing protein [Bacteroidota bacterium]
MKTSCDIVAPAVETFRILSINKRILAGLVILCFASVSPLMASGTLKGKVLDKDTKEPLPGANVIVDGTSVGTAADLNGAYTLVNVPSGEVSIKITYIGYVSVTVSLTVGENETVNRDFTLKAATIEGQEVIVTGQALGQVQAINQQLSSNKIASIVSEARIQELPDFNAAQAIGRLPGVSTLSSSGEANKIVIRGLAPQFNAVAVGGITMASTGSTQIGAASQVGTGAANINQDRSVDLSMVTPYMIKSVEVFKSLTPDLNANAIGGFVNMNLREAPEGFRTDLMFQSGYTQKSNNYGNYRAVFSASDRFFDGDLGFYGLGNIERYDRDADNMNASYSTLENAAQPNAFGRVTVTTVNLNRHFETRKRFGANLIVDYRLPAGTLKSVNVFSRLNANTRDFTTILDYQFHNINFRYRQGENTTDAAVNSLEFNNDFGFLSMELKVANSYSRNHLPYAPQLDFSQTGGIPGQIPDNTVPDSLKNLVSDKGPLKTYLTSISLFSADYKENDQVYKGDFKVPVRVEDITSGFLKFGGEFRYNYRTNDQGTPYANIRGGSTIGGQILSLLESHFGFVRDSTVGQFPGNNFTSSEGNLYDTFLDGRFGQLLWAPDASTLNSIVDLISHDESINANHSSGTNAGGWFETAFQRFPNKYRYIEKYHAGYLMSELNFGQDLMVVGGVRWEEVKSLFDAYNLVDGRDATSQTVDSVSAHPWNRYVLPMVQTKLNMFDWVDIRYAYTQTLARPDYHQLSPHFTIGWTKADVWAGNPRLVPARATNHDVFLTFHNNELGLFSIGGFYKEVRDFTYYTQYHLQQSPSAPGLDSLAQYAVHTASGGIFIPLPSALLHTYTNSPHPAYIRGFEVDLQTRFWYLPEPLNGILLGINYTHISSQATYPWRKDTTIVVPPRSTKVVTLDYTRTGRLINQPNDILNAYLGYDNGGFSGRLSFLFQGNSVSAIGPFAEQDGFTNDYFRIDISARQTLPWPGLQLFLDVTNLNNRKNDAAQASIGGFTSQQYYGLVAKLGVRYQM